MAILELRLDGQDGIELLRRIQQDQRTIRTIIHTELHFLKNGRRPFVQKVRVNN
jgi:CheY-like chemotaxis protein